ncbi:ABC transporter substrate-binding protein [Microbispora sp. H11081]|uniref:ABC transporter substrate-binding protein n=1 Tax=Microbispora sp. H11081 TaxID=2729107 RepID=UPI0014740588|nr:ABC transporter substrate-binding protein [Microbispora sp. H11081]
MQVRKFRGQSRRFALTVSALLSATLISGCVSSASEPDAARPADASSEGKPVSGGIFRHASVGVQSNYDPLKRGALDSSMVAIYDSLTRFNDQGTVEPYLAESLESTDAKTWTLKLRPNVKFHDGTAFDAEAVVFNIERHLDPDNASSARSFVTDIEKVEAKDPLTVVFTLASPIASFPANLTTAAGAIASPTAIKAAGEDYGRTSAVGAGAFKFDKWVPNQVTVMKKNPDYWQQGLPYLDEFHEIPMSDTQSRFAAFQGKNIESAWFQEPNQIKWARENPTLATLHEPKGGVGGTGLIFNLEKPPFDDVRVRRAAALAVNTDALDQALFQGGMPHIKGPFREGSFWYTGKAQWPGYDQEEAKKLVAEVEAEKGPLSFTLGCHNAPDRRRYIELIQNMLSQVGMDVKLDTPDVAQYVAAVFAKDYQIGCWPRNSTDPDLILFPTFTCKGPTTSNSFGYCNPAADEALTRGRQSLDPEERKAAYADFEEVLSKDLPMVFHWADNFSIITQPNVKGYTATSPADWSPAYLWIEK